MDLRCNHKLHGRLVNGLFEVKCPSSHCKEQHGAPIVLHYYDPITGEHVDTKCFQDPADVVRSHTMRGEADGARHRPASVRTS